MKTYLKSVFVIITILLIGIGIAGLVGFYQWCTNEVECENLKWIFVLLCTDSVMLTIFGVFIGKFLEHTYED